jgi:alkylation response protein AidB-like acyl-CoA dehydrogenase
MSHETRPWISYEALTELAGKEAAARDRDGGFPGAAFEDLRRLGLTGKPPLKSLEATRLFRVLAAIGRGDLSVGRIFEGHVNALSLIRMFGNPEQQARYQTLAAGGALFGIWNTDVPLSPVTLRCDRLEGKKNFASGIDGLSYALITASTPRGRQLLIIPVDGLPVDRSWWHPLGMRASGSHVVEFGNVEVPTEALIGEPNDYLREPWFTAGAIRFAAVHVGGMHAVLDATVAHLRKSNRANDPHQRHRLGQMAVETATGYAWLDHSAGHWAAIERAPAAETIATLSAARLAIERAALNVLELGERSIGAAGMIAPHPLERLVRDLRTYLRQPNPDAALATIGGAVTDGSWNPNSEHGQLQNVR